MQRFRCMIHQLRRSITFRHLISLGSLVVLGGFAVAACSTDETNGGANGPGDTTDAGPKARKEAGSGDEQDSGGPDANENENDQSDAGPEEVYGPGKDGDECFFNADCAKGLRCEAEATADVCRPGARGKGTFGTTCAGNNDCASGLCVEEACSDACTEDKDCAKPLPACRFESFCGPPPKG